MEFVIPYDHSEPRSRVLSVLFDFNGTILGRYNSENIPIINNCVTDYTDLCRMVMHI